MTTVEKFPAARKQLMFIAIVLILLLLAAAYAANGRFKNGQPESINHLTWWQKTAAHPVRSSVSSLGLLRSEPLAAQNVTLEPGTGALRVMILLDTSESKSAENRLTLARQGAKLLVNFLNLGDSVGVISFDYAAQISFPLTKISGTGTKTAAKSAIDAMTPGSSTLIGGGLQAALDQFKAQPERSSKNIIVLLTDRDYAEGASPDTIIPSFDDSGIAAWTVGVGAGISTAGQAVLQRIASQTGGKYFHVSDSSRLVGVFFQLLLESRIKSNGLLVHEPLAVSSGQLKNLPVEVEAGAESAIFGLGIADPADRITLSLHSPSGSVITMADAKANNPNIEFISESNSKAFLVFAPEPGTWKIVVKAGTIKTGELDIFASAEHDGLQLTASLTKNIVVFPEVAHIQAIPTFAGENVVGTTVTGTVTRPDGSKVSVSLFDDGLETHGDSVRGDGIYSSRFNRYRGGGTYSFELTAKNLNGMTHGGTDLLSFSPLNAKPVLPFTRMVSTTAVVTGVPTTDADLSVNKTDEADPVLLGEQISYHIVVTNSGPSDATGVVVTDRLPSSSIFVSATSSSGSCSLAPNNKVVCNIGDMTNGATASVAIVVKSSGNPNTIFNTAGVTANEADSNSANNEASEATTLVGLRRLSFMPVILTGGCQNSTGTLLLTSPAPQGGLAVTLHSNNLRVHVPPTMMVNEGETSATFLAQTDVVMNEQVAIVTATAGSNHVSGNVKLLPLRMAVLQEIF